MKHAFLIYAHEEPLVLATLLELLDHPRADIFLHTDPRNPDLATALEPLPLHHAHLFRLSPEQEVNWGDFSQVEVEMRLYELAHEHGPYAHYHLLSGVDLPLKPMDDILAHFDAHPTKEFIGFWNSEEHRRDLDRRVHRYYLFTNYLRRNKAQYWQRRLTVPLRNLSLSAQKLLRYRRHRHRAFHKGFNWCSLTHACITHLLEHRDEITAVFRHVLAPDEIYKQTLIAESLFLAAVYDPSDPERGTARRIDWERGRPYEWQSTDIAELLATPHCFARKFNACSATALRKALLHE